MQIAAKGMTVAATLLLAGCAMSAHRPTTTANTNAGSADATIRACETTIYYTSNADRETTLDCARVLDIWQ